MKAGGRSLRAPVWVMPGQPDNSINLQFGYGRTRLGQVGNNIGYNAFALRTADQPWTLTGVEVTRTGDTYDARQHAGPLQHGRAQPGAHRHAR